MVFNGEVYNFQEIKKKLPEYPFHTTGDTEVIIAAFAKYGPECLQLLPRECLALGDMGQAGNARSFWRETVSA